jgi:phosphatidylserine decarboxylase
MARKSSTENERTTVAVQSLTNHQVVFRQIAGYVARRIVFYCNIEDKAKAGHEFGFIKFGSRMDVFCLLIQKSFARLEIRQKADWM